MKEMKFKSQPYLSKQCGQSCIAMITGKKIKKICKEIGKEYTTDIYGDLKPYLDKNGYTTSITYGSIEINEVPNNSIIRLKKPDNSGHFVLKTTEGKIYDPSIGIVEKYMNQTTISHYLNFQKRV